MRIPVASAIAFPAAVKNAEMFVCKKSAPPSKVRLIKLGSKNFKLNVSGRITAL